MIISNLLIKYIKKNMKTKINNLLELSELIHKLFLNNKELHCRASLKEMSNTDILTSINIWKKYWFEAFDKMLLSNINFENVINDLKNYDIFINQIVSDINKFNFIYVNQDFKLGVGNKQTFENHGLIKFQNAVSKFKLKDYCIGDAVNCDSFECEDNSILTVRKCKSIKGWQNSKIEAHDVNFIEVYGNCIVDAYNVKEIIAHDYCIIRADENCKISAEEDCIVSTSGINRVTIIPSINICKLNINE